MMMMMMMRECQGGDTVNCFLLNGIYVSITVEIRKKRANKVYRSLKNYQLLTHSLQLTFDVVEGMCMKR